MKKINIFYTSLFFVFIFFIFRNWFLAPEIIGGDWPYFYNETLKDYSFFFSSWNPLQSNGFGGMSPMYSLGVFHGFTIFLSQTFHLSWPFTYKFSWFGLFIGLSVFSSMYLLKVALPRVKFWQQIFASMIFSTNTYILMAVSGGQMGVALAYSVAPLVLTTFIKLINLTNSLSFNSKFVIQNSKFSIIAGLVLGLQVMFDSRIAYLTMIVVCIYIIFITSFIEFSAKKIFSFFLSIIFFGFGLPVAIAALLHATWILPILFHQSNPIPQGLTNVDGFRFLSFADFSHAFSLLHPNWPENVFGKTYFLKPEFLLLPIMAYSSLLFIRSILQLKPQSAKNALTVEQHISRTIIFFVLLGLLGTFLVKGASIPFGEANRWLFVHVPGMNFFRDPTKFYLLVILSYSMLIPFSLWKTIEIISRKIRATYYIIPVAFLAFWLFLIHPAIFGKLQGTFQKNKVPKEYILLKDYLYKQPAFFRTLWFPRQQRFTFFSNTHPSVEAVPLFNVTNSAQAIAKLKEKSQEYLSELSIKYVVVPYDSLGEIFIDDRKYDQKQYEETIAGLKKITWLKKIDGFGRIAVFEVSSPKNHIWLTRSGNISYYMASPVRYFATVSIPASQKLIFSEKHNPYWVAKVDDKIIFSEKTQNSLNSFALQKGKYNFEIIFLQDKFYSYGRAISLFTLLITLFFVLKYRKNAINHN